MSDVRILYSEGKPYGVICKGDHSITLLSSFGGGTGALDQAIAVQEDCRQCKPPSCERHGPHVSRCLACLHEREAAKLDGDFEKATKVQWADWGGWWTDDDEAFGRTDDEPDDIPALEVNGVRFVWGTTELKAGVDLEDECTSNWLQDHHENAGDFVDWAKIRQAQALVDEALEKVVSYETDRSVAILLPDAEGAT